MGLHLLFFTALYHPHLRGTTRVLQTPFLTGTGAPVTIRDPRDRMKQEQIFMYNPDDILQETWNRGWLYIFSHQRRKILN